MRGHVDDVTSTILGCVDYRLIGLLILNMHQVARHTRRRRDILRFVQILARESRHVFPVLLSRVRDDGYVRDHCRGVHEDMERGRYGYDGDPGTKSLGQRNTFLKRHLR